MNNIWPLVHAERAALISDLADLDTCQWQQQSLCAKWNTHDVVAHLVDNARTTRLGFLAGMVRARFDFDRLNDRGVDRERRDSPAQTLAALRLVSRRRSTPPAHLDSRLVEEIVHGEDIRRPLELTRDYPHSGVIRAIHYQLRTPASFGGAKELGTRIRLIATDADVSIGSGPQVSGPALSLLLALTGRSAALSDLHGPGTGLLTTLK